MSWRRYRCRGRRAPPEGRDAAWSDRSDWTLPPTPALLPRQHHHSVRLSRTVKSLPWSRSSVTSVCVCSTSVTFKPEHLLHCYTRGFTNESYCWIECISLGIVTVRLPVPLMIFFYLLLFDDWQLCLNVHSHQSSDVVIIKCVSFDSLCSRARIPSFPVDWSLHRKCHLII